MIQRIQTLYLLLAAALVSTTLLLPLANLIDGSAEFTLRAFALVDSEGATVQPMVWLGVLLALSTALPLVTIFLFRNRMLQVRLCVAEAVLLVGSLIMTGIYCYLGWRSAAESNFGEFSIQVWVIMPLLSLILTLLAARAIFKDEVLVRSLDRIR